MSLPNRPWNDPARFQLTERPCPYFNQQQCRCGASFSGMPVRRARKRLYCLSDDFDTCPLYLCQMLRQSQPRATDRTSREFADK